jgi:hypothetical protein
MPNAFVDFNFGEEETFCSQLLGSPEFSFEDLKSLLPIDEKTTGLKKPDIAARLASYIVNSKVVKPHQVLLKYAQKNRPWLSFQKGTYAITPNLQNPNELLTSFGADGWYGPIEDNEFEQVFYIRTFTVPYYSEVESEGEWKIERYKIRWHAVARIRKDHVAIKWDGFTTNPTNNSTSRKNVNNQFPFWNHISNFLEELAIEVQADWSSIKLRELVLHDLWNKYRKATNGEAEYIWKHLRIRAESDGVALNAHTSGIADIDINGIQSLSEELASAVLKAVKPEYDDSDVKASEDAILKTLIQEWGAKSYEFELELKEIKKEGASFKKIFRAHCYFGLSKSRNNQDSLQHLKCYSKYGGSDGCLTFLLSHIAS